MMRMKTQPFRQRTTAVTLRHLRWILGPMDEMAKSDNECITFRKVSGTEKPEPSPAGDPVDLAVHLEYGNQGQSSMVAGRTNNYKTAELKEPEIECLRGNNF